MEHQRIEGVLWLITGLLVYSLGPKSYWAVLSLAMFGMAFSAFRDKKPMSTEKTGTTPPLTIKAEYSVKGSNSVFGFTFEIPALTLTKQPTRTEMEAVIRDFCLDKFLANLDYRYDLVNGNLDFCKPNEKENA